MISLFCLEKDEEKYTAFQDQDHKYNKIHSNLIVMNKFY